MIGELVALVVGIVVGAFVRGAVQDWLGTQEHLREQRSKLYGQVLSPYAHALRNTDEALERITSPEYQTDRFVFVMIADDAAVRKQTEMLSAFMEGEDKSGHEREAAMKRGLRRFGELLVQLRKDMGNKDTQLSPVEMLEGVGIGEARQFLSGDTTP